jgi:hypothetical protein
MRRQKMSAGDAGQDQKLAGGDQSQKQKHRSCGNPRPRIVMAHCSLVTPVGSDVERNPSEAMPACGWAARVLEMRASKLSETVEKTESLASNIRLQPRHRSTRERRTDRPSGASGARASAKLGMSRPRPESAAE